ncbi:MAG TPA: DHH family phosphoesterase [Candidatus Saccharimonadales bacterium]|nr:DHH family phosphoesterase [Candidatus Saccharimonadales bacterium]
MHTHVITSRYPFIDIDAYGAMVGYAELLNIQGMKAIAATSAKLNESIPHSLRALGAPVEVNYRPEPGETFAVVDDSDSKDFDPMVNPQRLTEIIDHHPGFETYWRRYLRDKADIEVVGACCTMIYERWARASLLGSMSPRTATLLACGILDNTLNFQAHITTVRDQQAYRDLQNIAQLPSNWPATYFSDCQQGIEHNLEEAIKNDTKIVEFRGQPSVYAVGQIVIWDAQAIINDHLETIKRVVSGIEPTWFANVVSIKGDRSYFVCTDPGIQRWLANLLGIRFSGSVAPADRLWLRKEIVMAALQQHTGRA